MILSNNEKAIGVFDSGLGGISVLRQLKHQMPNEHYIYYGDSAFAPYGEKSKEEITKHCFEIMEFFIQHGVKAVVIACNTATSACVNDLRKAYPELPIIGMEPALKVVADGKKDHTIIVMATHFTLKEKKFHDLMARYSNDNTIIKLPTPKLVEIVEQNKLQDDVLVDETLHEYLDPYMNKTVHSIVLGCTHFVFYKEKIKQIVGEQILVVDGNEGTARHVEKILKDKGEQRDDMDGEVEIYNSSNEPYYLELSEKLLEQDLK